MPRKKQEYTGNTEARRRATTKYLNETVETIAVRVPAGQKQVFKDYARSIGVSLNVFAYQAMLDAMNHNTEKKLC